MINVLSIHDFIFFECRIIFNSTNYIFRNPNIQFDNFDNLQDEMQDQHSSTIDEVCDNLFFPSATMFCDSGMWQWYVTMLCDKEVTVINSISQFWSVCSVMVCARYYRKSIIYWKRWILWNWCFIWFLIITIIFSETSQNYFTEMANYKKLGQEIADTYKWWFLCNTAVALQLEQSPKLKARLGRALSYSTIYTINFCSEMG